MSHLLPVLSQCDMGHALTESSSSHSPTSSELNFFHPSSSDRGDCTHPASNAIPVGPAVAKRLREERERDPTHTISPTDSSSPPIPTLHLYWDKVGATLIFLPLTNITKKVMKYKKHCSTSTVPDIRELSLIADANYSFVRHC